MAATWGRGEGVGLEDPGELLGIPVLNVSAFGIKRARFGICVIRNAAVPPLSCIGRYRATDGTTPPGENGWCIRIAM